MQAVGFGIDVAINDIGCQDMFGVRIRIAEEISERNGGEGVVVGGNELEEFHVGID